MTLRAVLRLARRKTPVRSLFKLGGGVYLWPGANGTYSPTAHGWTASRLPKIFCWPQHLRTPGRHCGNHDHDFLNCSLFIIIIIIIIIIVIYLRSVFSGGLGASTAIQDALGRSSSPAVHVPSVLINLSRSGSLPGSSRDGPGHQIGEAARQNARRVCDARTRTSSTRRRRRPGAEAAGHRKMKSNARPSHAFIALHERPPPAPAPAVQRLGWSGEH